MKNLTPFVHFQCQKMGPGRRYHDTLVLKGTFVLASGTLALADEPAPIVIADDYWDEANATRSSLRRAGEVLLAKPATDVLVTGTARAPAGKPLAEWDCAVVVRGAQGTLLSHSVQVTGPRAWVYRALGGWKLDGPKPTASVPVRYELAYGGAYLDSRAEVPRALVHRPNPCGSGHFDESSLDRSRAYPGPQWQLRAQPVTDVNREVPVAGLGPVARTWASRSRYAGTYDRAWEDRLRAEAGSGLPADYPPDFDLRFFQCAPAALVTREHLRGDEHIGLAGLTGEASDLVFRLPGARVSATVRASDGPWHDRPAALDTVHIDLDAGRVALCWRLTLDPAWDVRAAVLTVQGDEPHA